MCNIFPPLFYLQDAPEGEKEHERAVAGVPEHDGEEEGEGDDGIDGRVGLPVGGHPVGIDESLEGAGELVGAEEGGRRLRVRHLVQNWR